MLNLSGIFKCGISNDKTNYLIEEIKFFLNLRIFLFLFYQRLEIIKAVLTLTCTTSKLFCLASIPVSQDHQPISSSLSYTSFYILWTCITCFISPVTIVFQLSGLVVLHFLISIPLIHLLEYLFVGHHSQFRKFLTSHNNSSF